MVGEYKSWLHIVVARVRTEAKVTICGNVRVSCRSVCENEGEREAEVIRIQESESDSEKSEDGGSSERNETY